MRTGKLLPDKIQRIIHQTQMHYTMNTLFSKGTLVLTICIAISTGAYAQQQKGAKKPSAMYASNGKERYTSVNNDKTYQMEFEDGKMTAFSIDGTVIPAEKWNEYNTLISEVLEQMKRDKKQAELDMAQAQKDREQADRDRAQAMKDMAQAEKDRNQANLDRMQADIDRKQADRGRELAMKNRALADLDRQRADKDRAQAERDRAQADKDRLQADKDRLQADKDRLQAEKDRARAEEDREMLEALLTDLVNDKIANDKDDIHEVILKDNELIVNGQKQSDELYQKYISKYKAYSGKGFTYKANGISRSFQRYQ
jgi:colicin import membrane protein